MTAHFSREAIIVLYSQFFIRWQQSGASGASTMQSRARIKRAREAK
jgi:hypothetical protein